jgi:hypothetical protein
MIKKYSTYIFEAVKTPIEDNVLLNYNQWYQDNYDAFKTDIIDELKNKLVGKTIYIDGKYQKPYRNYRPGEKREEDPLDIEIIYKGKNVKRLYKIKVKDVQYDGSHTREVQCVELIDEDGNRFKLKRIVTKEQYDRFAKKAEGALKEIEEKKRKKEELRLKHVHHDPYGEELWEDDD